MQSTISSARRIEAVAALALFARLPTALRLGSLSPDFVIADAARRSELRATFVSYEEADRFWLHAFHRVDPPGSEDAEIQSAYGYGGPLANSTDPHFLDRAWGAYQKWAGTARVVAEFVRFHPLARNDRFYGGSISQNRETVVVDLEVADAPAEYQPRVRTAIRKAQSRGVSFAWADRSLIPRRFADFYRTAMAGLSAASFYFFTDAYFDALATLPGVRLGVCSRNGEWLSAGTFIYGGDCVEYHLSANSAAGRSLCANNLLLHEAVLAAQSAGYRQLYLGGGTDASPANPLLLFKSGYSTRRAAFRVGSYRHPAGN